MDERNDAELPSTEDLEQILVESQVELNIRKKIDTIRDEILLDDGSTLVVEMDVTTSYYALGIPEENLVMASDVPHVHVEPTPDNPLGETWSLEDHPSGTSGTSSSTAPETEPPENSKKSSANDSWFSYSSFNNGHGEGKSSDWGNFELPSGLAWSKGSFLDNMPEWLNGTEGFVSYDVNSYFKK